MRNPADVAAETNSYELRRKQAFEDLVKLIAESAPPKSLGLGGDNGVWIDGLADDSACIAIAEALKSNTSIVKASFSVEMRGHGEDRFDGVTESGTKALGLALKHNKNLKHVTFYYFKIDASAAEAFSDAFRANSTLERLEFSSCQLSDLTAMALAPGLKANTGLKSLTIFQGQITGLGARALFEALRFNKTLKEISMGQNPISDHGLEYLSEVIKTNTTLSDISFEQCHIGPIGAIALGNALKINQSLQRVNLTNNKIGDIGITALAEALKTNQSLRSLSLYDHYATDAGCKAMGRALQQNSTLTYLHFSNKKMSKNYLDWISQKLTYNKLSTQIREKERPAALTFLLGLRDLDKNFEKPGFKTESYLQTLHASGIYDENLRFPILEYVLPFQKPVSIKKSGPQSSTAQISSKNGDLTPSLAMRYVLDLSLLTLILNACMRSEDNNILPEPEVALRRAAAAGRTEVIEKLIEIVKDLDINQADPDGNTAIMIAKDKHRDEAYDLLLKAGAKVPVEAAVESTVENADEKDRGKRKFE